MEGHPIRGLVLILSFVAFNALVSAAEAAIQNVNESNVKKRVEEGDKKAKGLYQHLIAPNRYIIVIEILLTFVSLSIGMTYSTQLYGFIQELVKKSPMEEAMAIISGIVMVMVTLVIIYFIVLFGMLLPRKLAKKHSETVAYSLYGFLSLFVNILKPFLWLLEKSSNGILRLFGLGSNDFEENVTEEEIISMVNEGQEQGVLEHSEAEMISNIIEFNEKSANDIMTHRKKMVAISCELTIEEALQFMLDENYSRFPLYDGDIDNIVGLLHLRDVMLCYLDPVRRNEPLTKIARQPYFVPDTKSIDALFHDMQSKKIHMAIAIDEYGQTAGIVAMEDILEEIVGDIQDEYDDEEEHFTRVGEDSYLIRGSASLEDLEEELEISFEEEDMNNYDTLNGLLISLLDHIPDENEKAVIRYCGHEYELMEVHNRMVDLVRVRKLSEEELLEDENRLANLDLAMQDAINYTDEATLGEVESRVIRYEKKE